jgi:hypothetical protein
MSCAPCAHCHRPLTEHAEGKCLFEATAYKEMTTQEHISYDCLCTIVEVGETSNTFTVHTKRKLKYPLDIVTFDYVITQ